MEADDDAADGLVAVHNRKTMAVRAKAETAKIILCFFIIAISDGKLTEFGACSEKLLLNRAEQKEKPPPQFLWQQEEGALCILQLSHYRVTSVTSLSPGLKTRPRHFFAEAL